MFGMAGMMGSAASTPLDPDPVVAVWQTGTPTFGTYTVTTTNDSIECSSINSWARCGLVNHGMVAGEKYSIDIRVNSTTSPQRQQFGVSTTDNPGTRILEAGDTIATGMDLSTWTNAADIMTINFDGSTGAVLIYENGVLRATADPAIVGASTWYFCVQEYKGYPTWTIVPQVYAPPSGYAKIIPVAA